MSAPDHWVTLCFLGQGSGWSRPKLLSVSVITSGGHAILSIALGLAVAVVGLVFAQEVSNYASQAIGGTMVFAGLLYGFRTLSSSESEDYEKEAEEDRLRIEGRKGRGLKYFAVMGGALSPDLSILPVFVLAAPEGPALLSGVAILYAVVSIFALLLFVVAGSMGLSRIFKRVPPKYNDALVGFVIAAVGAYVLLGG
jgi:nickel/cobalt exporter